MTSRIQSPLMLHGVMPARVARTCRASQVAPRGPGSVTMLPPGDQVSDILERSWSIRAWPRLAAYVVYTATITSSTRPIVPEYCRPAATVTRPFFARPVSSKTGLRLRAEVPGQERAHHIARSALVPAGAIEQVVQAAGPIQAGCLCDRPAVSRDLRHQQPTQIQQAVRPRIAAAVDRREVRRELVEYRFHQPGIYTGGAGLPVFVMRPNIMITGGLRALDRPGHRRRRYIRCGTTQVTSRQAGTYDWSTRQR